MSARILARYRTNAHAEKCHVRAILLIAAICTVLTLAGTASAQIQDVFDSANSSLLGGEYGTAIAAYDSILEEYPDNASVLTMKGIAQSNSGMHRDSLRQFFAALQQNPHDAIVLTGMGVGFGNLGEYEEAARYLEMAQHEMPDNIIIENYRQHVAGITAKYPYTPTEKPTDHTLKPIPSWIKNLAGWWSSHQITDDVFFRDLEYLIANGIIEIPQGMVEWESGTELPVQLSDDIQEWSKGLRPNEALFSGVRWLAANGFIDADTRPAPKSPAQMENERRSFEKYLSDIARNVASEKRYIESSNPSQDVIKKFLRDYVKWNFEAEAQTAASMFPDPTYEDTGDEYVIHYTVFVNEQPTGLPLDHTGTLNNSFDFWEQQELSINDKKARVEFEVTDTKHEANVWVTWVIRDIGEGVLGHAHLGKGIVEVTLGDYGCDGSFQLYDVDSVETIMTHELGHSIGLRHTADMSSIMYPSYAPAYAYCLLG